MSSVSYYSQCTNVGKTFRTFLADIEEPFTIQYTHYTTAHVEIYHKYVYIYNVIKCIDGIAKQPSSLFFERHCQKNSAACSPQLYHLTLMAPSHYRQRATRQ